MKLPIGLYLFLEVINSLKEKKLRIKENANKFIQLNLFIKNKIVFLHLKSYFTRMGP